MNTLKQDSNDDGISRLLRASRPAPALPPRFQEHVWRRIEQANARPGTATWIDTIARLVLKPQFALATVAIVLLTGTLLGSLNGQEQARQVAQARYVGSVAMPIAP